MDALTRNYTKLSSGIFLIFLILFISGCAYFNIFYNAKKSYNNGIQILEESDSRKIPPNAETEFRNTIEKASKVLSLYPGSRLIDDAIMLIGQSFYYLGEYIEAQRKFEELFNNFPDSKFVPEAHLYHAKILIVDNNFDLAETELNTIIASDTKEEIKSDAFFSLADLNFHREDYKGALEHYQRIVSEIKNKQLRSEAQLKVAESYFMMEEYTKAAEAYLKVSNYDPSLNIKYLSEFGYGSCLKFLGDYDKAIEKFIELLSDDNYINNYTELLLDIAYCWELKGNVDQAIYVLKQLNDFDPNGVIPLQTIAEDIAAVNPERPSITGTRINYRSPEALYYIGELYLKKYSDIQTASEYYSYSLKAKPSPEIITQCNNRIAYISEIQQLSMVLHEKPPVLPIFKIPESPAVQKDSAAIKQATKELEPEGIVFEDSVKYLAALKSYNDKLRDYLERVPNSIYRIAEIYLTEFENPDSAFHYLDKIINIFPGNLVAAKALFLQINIAQSHNVGDREQLKSRLLKNYGNSEYALYFMSDPDEKTAVTNLWLSRRDSVRVLFEEAENAFFQDDYESSVALLQSLVDRFPDSEFAAKALYTIAWIYEYHLNDPDEVVKAYKKLTREFGDSEYSRAIAEKLRQVNIVLDAQKRGQALQLLAQRVIEERKLAQQKAKQDSIRLENILKTVPNPNSNFLISIESDSKVATPSSVVEDIAPEYPDSLLVQGITGYIDLKLFINTDGFAVEEVLFRNTTENRIFEQAIYIAAEESRYSPALDAQNLPVSAWHLRRYIFPKK